MKMNKRIPSGFKTKTLKQTRESLKLCNVMAKIMEKYGFRLTAISALYPMSESFPRVGADDRFKLVDSTGDVLCVASDQVTGMLNATERDLERLCSFGEVYKFGGESKNEMQFASLLAGFSGLEAECEMITSGISLMRELGVECGKIILTNTTILQGIAEVYLNGKADFDVIRRVLNGEDYEFKTDTDIALKKLLVETASTKGNIKVLEGVAEKLKNPTSVSGIYALLELSKMLDELGLNSLVEFDLSIIGQIYDSGTVFKLCDAAGNVFIEGGRHDFFREGGVVRAVSIRINPDKILEVHPLLAAVPQCDAVIAIADGIKALKCAYRLKNSLTDNNLSVTLLYRTGKREAVEYANAFDIESVIYIDERGNIIDVERPYVAPQAPVEERESVPAPVSVEEPAPVEAPAPISELGNETNEVADEPVEETTAATVEETLPATKSASKTNVKSTPKTGASAKPAQKANATKPAPTTETKPTPKTGAKSAPKTGEKPAPKTDAKPAPKTGAKPASKTETKSTPKTGTKPAPKTETQSKTASKTGTQKKNK